MYSRLEVAAERVYDEVRLSPLKKDKNISDIIAPGKTVRSKRVIT